MIYYNAIKLQVLVGSSRLCIVLELELCVPTTKPAFDFTTCEMCILIKNSVSHTTNPQLDMA